MSELNDRLKGAGMDVEFLKQLRQLEELEKFVKEGKMKESVYKEFENQVFKAKEAQKEAEEAAAASKVKKGGGIGSFANLIKRNKKTPASKLKDGEGNPLQKSRTKTRGQSFRSRGESMKSNVSSRTLKRNGTKTRRETKKDMRVIIEGSVFKFDRKKGKKTWRAIYCVLYPDRLEFTKGKGGKIVRAVPLTEDSFVSIVANGQVRRAGSKADLNIDPEDLSSDEEEKNEKSQFLTSDLAKCPELNDMANVFVLASLSKPGKIYVACGSEQVRAAWVAMMVELIRDMASAAKDDRMMSFSSATMKKNKIWDMKSRATQFVQKRINRLMQSDVAGMDEAEVKSNFGKIKKQGDKFAQKAFLQDWTEKEKKNVKMMVQENQRLKVQVHEQQQELRKVKEEKENEIKQIKKENERELKKEKVKNEELNKKYEELMKNYRAEAQKRNKEREVEKKRIEKRINALRRRSVMPSGDVDSHYKEQFEKLKKKLEAIQSALDLDTEQLGGWDGSLEMAEEKMKECLKLILEGETPMIQAKAQTEFDKWDRLVRGHKDFKAREEDKWKGWEDENFDKNEQARDDMREKFVPKEYLKGCSVEKLMELKGIKKKTAKRIFENKIFKFLWMDEALISKLHVAALTNDYAAQGLDIRELRAVYACLPTEFQNDSTGGKATFRDNMRSRLHTLTEKEKNGTLSAAEKMHNAYRDKAVREQVKPKLPLVKREKVEVSGKLKMQAAMLANFFAAQQGGGPPKKKKPVKKEAGTATDKTSDTGKSDGALDANDSKWKKYFMMQRQKIPEGAIKQKMAQEGHDPSLWDELKALKGKASKKAAPKEDEFNAKDPKWKKYLNMQKFGLDEGAILAKMAQEGVDVAVWDKLKAAQKASSPKPKVLDPDDEIWSEYFKMKRIGNSEGQILNKMQKDGRDPGVWSELLAIKMERDAREKEKQKTLPGRHHLDIKDFAATPNIVNTKKSENLKPSDTNVSGGSDDKPLPTADDELRRAMNLKKKSRNPADFKELDENGNPKKRKKKRKTKKFSTTDIDPEQRKKTLRGDRNRRASRKKKSTLHALTGDTKDLLAMATKGLDIDEIALGSTTKSGRGIIAGMMDYEAKNHKRKKKKKKSVKQSGINMLEEDSSLREVVDYILTDGEFDEVEGGTRTMKFGDLFDNFIVISDVLVGILLKAKRQGLVKYKGDMLFKGIHDEVKITAL